MTDSPAVTAAERVRAEAVVQKWAPWMGAPSTRVSEHFPKLCGAIATALAAVRAEVQGDLDALIRLHAVKCEQGKLDALQARVVALVQALEEARDWLRLMDLPEHRHVLAQIDRVLTPGAGGTAT